MEDKQEHGAVVRSVEPGSIAEEAGLQPGDRILRVNGRELRDVLDYQEEIVEEDVDLEFQRGDECGLVQIEKDYGEGLGVELADVVFDGVKQCKNRCVFCFIHQNPRGMRKTIWVRDDDYRLSFLEGHFVTLTNLTDEEWRRILNGHMSPLRVSVHATDPDVRTRMLMNKNAGRVLDQIRELIEHGIEVHCQAVLCPGWNDGAILDRTITDLAALHPGVGSLAIVPVGLTRFREHLPDLSPVTPEQARDVIKQVGAHQRAFKAALGSRFVFLGDEFYLMSGIALPKYTEYDGFPALDDGVGTCRWWDHRWRTLRKTLPASIPKPRRVTVVTGEMAGPILQPAIDRLNEIGGVSGTLLPVVNEFYGGGINVTGLVTGGDIRRALQGRAVGDALVVPEIMVRQGGFLDDVTVESLERAAGCPVCVVETSPKGLIRGVLG